jgi:hypothetical protein
MIPEVVIAVFQAIYYVVEIIQLIMESEIWGDFVEWFKSRTTS